ncbi:STAS domain-containing protein [Actinoplanes sp. NPDC051859]|uniref:STAS domain-containing protein n=1 Tax=Actinoplanes sp. NPDC051859 TaxID=3363909 RepID=UPI00378F384F
MSIQALVQADAGRLVVTISGSLDLATVATVRMRLMKCLAEQPDALLINVPDLEVREPLALAVFATVARQAQRWPGVPVLVCGPQPEARRILTMAAYRRLPVLPSVAAAEELLEKDPRVPASLCDELLPMLGAARQARNVATEACIRWDVPHLIAPASLIASELVSNVIDHARTIMDLRLTLRGRFLCLAVSDGSTTPPVPAGATVPSAAGGRGLMLVAASAHSWGWLPCEDGKVVWASLLI